MFTKQVKLSNLAKSQLARMKHKTGITNWNVLSRWAFCLSLREPSIPADIDIDTSNVEMSWAVFGGEYAEVYEALIRQRCLDDALGDETETLSKYFRLHLHRGIGYLASHDFVNSIIDLVKLPFQEIQDKNLEVREI